MKYVLLSNPEPTAEKTKREQVMEMIQPLIDDGDLTSAMIRYNQHMTAPEENEGPAIIRGRHYSIRNPRCRK